jgi:hypothetical protein
MNMQPKDLTQELLWASLYMQLKASYTSSLRPHTLVALRMNMLAKDLTQELLWASLYM